MKAGIIAAGEGSRLAQEGCPKPLLRVGGQTLLERTLRALETSGIEEVALVARDPRVVTHAEQLDILPVTAVTKVTDSSMHSLYELRVSVEDERFILCTVDSIIPPAEFAGFVQSYADRPEVEVLQSYTDYVDDEKPLRIAVDDADHVTAIGDDAEGSPFVTVGLYGIGPRAYALLEPAVRSGVKKLRNYLNLVLQSGVAMAGYRLSKAIDVDRPCDVRAAEDFLLELGL
jgi:choline kinase